jgi:hypothetical protein
MVSYTTLYPKLLLKVYHMQIRSDKKYEHRGDVAFAPPPTVLLFSDIIYPLEATYKQNVTRFAPTHLSLSVGANHNVVSVDILN